MFACLTSDKHADRASPTAVLIEECREKGCGFSNGSSFKSKHADACASENSFFDCNSFIVTAVDELAVSNTSGPWDGSVH